MAYQTFPVYTVLFAHFTRTDCKGDFTVSIHPNNDAISNFCCTCIISCLYYSLHPQIIVFVYFRQPLVEWLYCTLPFVSGTN